MDDDALRKSIVASVERIYNVHGFSSLELKAEVGFISVDLVYVTFYIFIFFTTTRLISTEIARKLFW